MRPMFRQTRSCLAGLILFGWALIGWPQEQSRSFTLENGLQVVVRPSSGAPLVAVSLACGIGVRDDDRSGGGRVHLLEHLLLVGSSLRRSAAERIRDIRGHGAQYNAHTDQDLMTFELSVPAEAQSWALETMREAVFENRFTDAEFANEKRVIAAEIAQLADDPQRSGTNLALQRLFTGHPYSHPLAGDAAGISAATVAELRTLYGDYFSPGNCVLVLAGPGAAAELEAQVREAFAGLKSQPPPQRTMSEASPPGSDAEIVHSLDVTQSHLFFVFAAPPFGHGDRSAFDILVHILGHGLNPLLGGISRHRELVIHGMSLRYLPLVHGGALVIHLVSDPENAHFLKKEMEKLLDSLARFNYSRADFQAAEKNYVTDFLEAAKNQIRLSMEAFQEGRSNMATSIGRYLLLGREKPAAESPSFPDGITSDELRRIAGRYLKGKKYVWLAVMPLGKENEAR